MNYGECPYCNDLIGFFEPEKLSTFAKVECESCGKDVWYFFSSVNPTAWTVEDFEKEFIVDSENRTIEKRV
jgi:hypothetical protein